MKKSRREGERNAGEMASIIGEAPHVGIWPMGKLDCFCPLVE